jgi:hypothetical protein
MTTTLVLVLSDAESESEILTSFDQSLMENPLFIGNRNTVIGLRSEMDGTKLRRRVGGWRTQRNQFRGSRDIFASRMSAVRSEMPFHRPGTNGCSQPSDQQSRGVLRSRSARHRGNLYAIFLFRTMIQYYIAEPSWKKGLVDMGIDMGIALVARSRPRK